MKNIAIIVPTLNKGGAERVAANLSIEFSRYYNVYLIVHDGRNITYPFQGELIDMKLYPSNNYIKKFFTFYKRIKFLKKVKEQYNIHYSISHLSSNLVNIFSRKNDKIYTYIHSMLKSKLKNKIKQKIIARYSDKVICVSKCVEENMKSNFKIQANKLVTIYNFFQPIKYKQTIRTKNKNIILINMGRLSEPKGQWHLIRAMSYVVKHNKNIKLKIIGDGDLKPLLESLIKALNLNKNIELCGYITNPFDLLSESDIYISSSLWEGLPMALIEAAYCNLPIISTDCDAGCREIIAPDTPINKKTIHIEYAKYGVLIPVCKSGTKKQLYLTNEEKIMAKAILELSTNSEKRLQYSKLSKNRSNDFMANKIMKEWIKLFK